MYSPCNRVSATNRFAKPQEEYHITITYIYKNIARVKGMVMKPIDKNKGGMKVFIIFTACILICPIVFLILIYFEWIVF